MKAQLAAGARVIGATLSILALGMIGWSTAALAAPSLTLDLHHGETNVKPGDTLELWFSVANVGNEETYSPPTLTVALPPGLSRSSVLNDGWICPGAPGDTVISCTAVESVPRRTVTYGAPATNLTMLVEADAGLSEGVVVATGTLEAGGAAAVSATETIGISADPAGFGIVPDSFIADFYEEDGVTPVRKSGAHPDLATFSFDLNNEAASLPGVPTFKLPKESLRDLEVELPPGFVGNPSAVAECTPSQLVAAACPRASQVGRIDLALETTGTVEANNFFQEWGVPVYNMVHPRGTVTDLAFNISENVIHIKASLNPANGYAIKTIVPNINQFSPVYFQKLTLWGVPGDPAHNSERCGFPNFTSEECSVEGSGKAFLTVPSQCGVNQRMSLSRYDSWQNSGAFGPDVIYSMPGQTTGCDAPRFEPKVTATPTGQEANSPSGLEVSLAVPQNENPDGVATPPVKSVKVTLPEGMTLSPSYADGLAGCSETQFGITHGGVPNEDKVACPDNSRIGAVSLRTPLLPRQLEGSLYLANQGDNPFDSTFAVYLAIHDTEERGVLLKIPGRLDANPATGQITTTFDDLPQLPFEEFSLAFRSGQRAPLINPPSCGSKTIGVEMASYAQPNELVDVSSAFEVTQGAEGSPCPPNPQSRPFSPDLSAGTVNPNAGSYSPFTFRLVRDDQEQEFSRITAMLPPGMLAKIAGIPYCPESAITAISSAQGTGKAQLASPACSASRIGSANTGVGAGTEPNYFPGSVYLAGPYKGAPLSLVIAVPALAGPYDFGTVVVRARVFVDPTTAQVSVESDPLPTIVHGVLLRIRDVRVNVDRPETTLNPTSCDPLSVRATVVSLAGATVNPSNRFQVANCSHLGFAPKLTMRFSGATKRSGNPALRATLTQPKGQANIGRVSVILPKHEFIDNAHINNPCTRVQFSEGSCPPKSILGFARAFTPLLDEPLEGPVYFRSNGGERELPDLVAALHGPFDVNLVGFIDAVQNKGAEGSRVRTIFASPPDAPVSKFVLNLYGGKRGLLENSVNLCKVKSSAEVKMTAHSGKAHDFNATIANQCKRKGKHGKGQSSDGR